MARVAICSCREFVFVEQAAAVLVSLVYLVACRLFALILLLARSDDSMEPELLLPAVIWPSPLRPSSTPPR